MLDLAYLLATVGFFATMLAYVRGCVLLGLDESDPEVKS